MTISRFVSGIPAPKGSSRAIPGRGKRKAILVASSSAANERAQKSWADAVRAAFADAGEPVKGPVIVSVAFTFRRPKSHGKAQRATNRHTSQPDLDKLLRCTLDALSGLAYVDDRQVYGVAAWKHYAEPGEPVGAHIEVSD